MDATAPWLVVGLGNPGKEYAGNRHNVGFLVADLLADRIGAKFGRHKRAVAEVAEGRLGIGGPRVVLAKPLTYMNLSGGPVAALAQFYKVPPDQIVAVHDELDMPVRPDAGEDRRRRGRPQRPALDVAARWRTKDYARVRFGIGRPPGRQDPADYVLSDFSAAERKELEFLVDRAADVVEAVVARGVEWAQNAYHGT